MVFPGSNPFILSNPFATRFTRPGSLRYRFPIEWQAPQNPGERDRQHESGQRIVNRLMAALRDRRAGLIVGPHGSGKTTLLHTLLPDLHREFSSVHFIKLEGVETNRLSQRWRHAWRVGRDVQTQQIAIARAQHVAMAGSQVATTGGRLDHGGLLIVDGAEQLSAWHWRRLMRTVRRRGPSLLATSHRPLPGVDVLYQTELDAKLIRGLTMRLLEQAPAEVVRMVGEQLSRCDLDRVSNLREFWFDLYDLVQPRLAQAENREVSKKPYGRSIVRHLDSVPCADGRRPADG